MIHTGWLFEAFFFVHVGQGFHGKTCLSTRVHSNLVEPKMDIGLALTAIHSWTDTGRKWTPVADSFSPFGNSVGTFGSNI